MIHHSDVKLHFGQDSINQKLERVADNIGLNFKQINRTRLTDRPNWIARITMGQIISALGLFLYIQYKQNLILVSSAGPASTCPLELASLGSYIWPENNNIDV